MIAAALGAWLAAMSQGTALAAPAPTPAADAATATPADGSAPADPGAAPASADDSQPAARDADPPPAAVELPRDVVGADVIDTILPCGVRVIAAEDGTLPVAAIVLAIETGSEDDPSDLPGLTHALAYQLLQGNREYGPGGVAIMANDAGGATSLASGPAQIRFESLVPVSLLSEMLRAEAHRLRAPTVDEHLWKDALTWARRDAARTWSVPWPALAEAHGQPGLGHDGRKVTAELTKLEPRQVAAMLADRFGYDRATLVVVAPAPPLASLALVQPLFADLPPRPRAVPARSLPKPAGDTPRPVPVDSGDGRVLAWPIPGSPAAVAWARVWCRTLNRQRRGQDENRRSRVRCSLDQDPRRPLLVVRGVGAEDAPSLIAGRLERLVDGSEDRLMTRQIASVRDTMELELRSPLPLAQALATAPPRAPDDESVTRAIHLLTGLAAVRDPAAGAPDPTSTLSSGAAVQLVPPAGAP